MNKMLKKALILGIIGFILGIFIGIIVWIFSPNEGNSMTLSVKNVFFFLVGGIFGLLAMGSTIIYDIESWSITKCTLTHFLATFFGFYLMAYIQEWGIFWNITFLYVTIPEIMAYIMVWLIQYLIVKNQIKKMNHMLNEIKISQTQSS